MCVRNGTSEAYCLYIMVPVRHTVFLRNGTSEAYCVCRYVIFSHPGGSGFSCQLGDLLS